MNDNQRWIIVSDGTPQTMYAGKTRLSEADLDSAIAKYELIELTECRAMRTLLIPAPQGGISQNEIITPISCARTGIRLKTKVCSYFWPDEYEAMESAFMAQIKQAEEAEVKMRAARSGIVTADAMKIGPGGKLFS